MAGQGLKERDNWLRGLLCLLLACAPLWGVRASSAAPQPVVAARLDLPVVMEAQAALEAARRAVQQQRWDAALPTLQELLEVTPNALVDDGGVYRPAHIPVNRLLAALPPEAADVYVALFGPLAKHRLQDALDARSLEGLRRVARCCALTPAGSRAAAASADLLMDAARWGAARRVLRRARSMQKQPADVPALAMREIICLARMGRSADALELAARMGAAQTVTVGGRDWKPVTFAEEAIRRLEPENDPAWQFGRAETAQAVRVSLPTQEGDVIQSDALASAAPLVDGPGVFVKAGGWVYALRDEPPRRVWAAPPPGALAESVRVALGGEGDASWLAPYVIPAESLGQWRCRRNRGLATLALAGGRLYCVQLHPGALRIPFDPWMATQEDLRVVNRLRCLDATTGRQLWSSAKVGQLAECWFFTAPALQAGRAYLVAVRSGELLAFCLDAATGQVAWATTIGGIRGRRQIRRYYWELFLSDACAPAVADDVVYLPTGQGIVVALDAVGGEPIWLAPYQRREERVNRLGEDLRIPQSPWASKPPFVAHCGEGDVVVVAPRDSPHLLAFSAVDGTLIWSRQFADGIALLGGAEGRAYVQASRRVVCLSVADGDVVWTAQMPDHTGVGVLQGGSVLIPAADGLIALDVTTGAQIGRHFWPWQGEGRGNLACGQSLLGLADCARLVTCPVHDGSGRRGQAAEPKP